MCTAGEAVELGAAGLKSVPEENRRSKAWKIDGVVCCEGSFTGEPFGVLASFAGIVGGSLALYSDRADSDSDLFLGELEFPNSDARRVLRNCEVGDRARSTLERGSGSALTVGTLWLGPCREDRTGSDAVEVAICEVVDMPDVVVAADAFLSPSSGGCPMYTSGGESAFLVRSECAAEYDPWRRSEEGTDFVSSLAGSGSAEEGRLALRFDESNRVRLLLLLPVGLRTF